MNFRTHAVSAALALSSAAFAQTPSLTIQPANGPLDPIMLSGSGSRGVRPHALFWDFPSTYTPMVDSMDALQSSPDGQFALGRSTLESRAARLSRSSGLTIFPVSSTGLVPHTAYASSSGGSPAVGYGFLGGSTQAFMWTTNGGTQDLGVRLGDRSSVLVDVSSGGSVAVGWGEPTGSSSRHPLRYDSQGFSRLSRAGGGFLTGGEATAVSSTGLVIVGVHTQNGAARGFRWTQSGGHIDLGSPADPTNTALETRANDVSTDGAWTVGQAAGGAGGSLIATIWDAEGTPYALADLLGEDPQLAVFQLRTIVSVSDNGQRVSGLGFDTATGQTRAYVATWSFNTPGDCTPDLGSAGGVGGQDGALDNNDFIVFIDSFFSSNSLSDFGSAGGVAGADGLFDNNDFIAYIDAFFTGCNG